MVSPDGLDLNFESAEKRSGERKEVHCLMGEQLLSMPNIHCAFSLQIFERWALQTKVLRWL